MTEKNLTESGITLQYKIGGVERSTIDELIRLNDLTITEKNNEVVATRKSRGDFVVFKWFSEEKEYYSNYSISTLKNSVMRESDSDTRIQTGFTGESVNSLENSLLEAIQRIITESRND